MNNFCFMFPTLCISVWSSPGHTEIRGDTQRELTLRRQMMWLAVDEVVHHDDVDSRAIVRTGSDIACNDPHTRDARVGELDPEERETAIARRGRDKTAEQQTAISTEKLYQRTGTTITLFVAWTTTVRLVHVSENRPESGDGRSRSSVRSGHEERRIGDIASHRCEQARTTKGTECGGVSRIAEEGYKAALWST